MTPEEQAKVIATIHELAVKSGAIMSQKDADFVEGNMKAMASIEAIRRQQFADMVADAVVRKLMEANNVNE